MKRKLIFISLAAALGMSLNANAGTCNTDAWVQPVTAQGGTSTTAEMRAGYEGDCVLVVNKPLSEPANSSAFVRYDFANGEPRVRGRFLVDPSGMDFANTGGGEARGRVVDIRRPAGGPSLLLSILIRNNNDSGYQFNVKWVGDDIGGGDRARGRCTDSWTDLPAGPASIEFDYVFESNSAADDGACTIYLDDVEVQAKTGLNNGAETTDSMRFGLIRGFQPSYQGEIVVDAVELRRQTSPGCVSGVGACP